MASQGASLTIEPSSSAVSGGDALVWNLSFVDVLYGIIALLGVVGNGLVLFVFFKVRQLRVTTNTLIRHQALVDFISSLLLPVTFIPPERNLSILHERRPFLASVVICKIWYSKYLFWTLIKVSTTNLVFLTLERYFAVLYPHQYRRRASTRMLVLVCASAWLIGASIEAYFPVINSIYDDGECSTRDFTPDRRAPIGYLSLVTTLVIPLVVMTFVYTSIIRFLRRHEANRAEQRDHPSVSNYGASSVVSVAVSTPPVSRRSTELSVCCIARDESFAIALRIPPSGVNINDDGRENGAVPRGNPGRRSAGELASEHPSTSDHGDEKKDRRERSLELQQEANAGPQSAGDGSLVLSPPELTISAAPDQAVASPSDDETNGGKKHRTRKYRTSAEIARRNILATMFIVCVTYFVCWTPDIMLYWHHNVVILHDWKEPFHRFAILLAYCNVCTNPIIYTLKYRSFQSGLETVFGRNCRVC